MFLKVLALALLFVVHSTSACTEFVVECGDESKTNIVARTMEWSTEFPFDWNINFEPKGASGKAILPNHCDADKALTWTSSYKVLQITAAAPIEGIEKVWVDGQNDAGLSVGALYFPGYAHYPEHVPTHKCSNAIQHIQVVNYIISTYSTVKEVKKALDEDTFPYIYAGKLPVPDGNGNFIDFVFPVHWSIIDVTGDAIVLEYTEKEGRRVHINEVGVFTNSPTYDWHTTNLKNYLSVQGPEYDNRSYIRNDVTHKLEPFGHGSGMLGLPGDFTPPSRFIRTAAFLRLAKKPPTITDGIVQAWHILNSVDITKDMMTGTTDWVVVKDLKNNIMYFRALTYLGIRKIDLNKLSGAEKTIVVEAPYDQCVVDVTDELKDKQSRKNEL